MSVHTFQVWIMALLGALVMGWLGAAVHGARGYSIAALIYDLIIGALLGALCCELWRNRRRSL